MIEGDCTYNSNCALKGLHKILLYWSTIGKKQRTCLGIGRISKQLSWPQLEKPTRYVLLHVAAIRNQNSFQKWDEMLFRRREGTQVDIIRLLTSWNLHFLQDSHANTFVSTDRYKKPQPFQTCHFLSAINFSIKPLSFVVTDTGFRMLSNRFLF